MVRGQDQLRAVRAERDQGQPQHRRGRGVEVGGQVLGEEPLEGVVLAGPVESGQVVVEPRQLDPVDHQLELVAVVVGHERGPQGGVPVEQGLSGRAHPVRVDGSGQVQRVLHLVRVERGVVQLRLEQQSRLERGQRPDVGESRIAAFPGLDGALGHGHQGDVRRRQTTRVGPLGIPGEADEGVAPQVGELAHLVGGEHARGGAEDGAEPGAVHGVGDGRVDVHFAQRGHPRVVPGVQLGQLREVRQFGGLGEAESAQFVRHVGGGEPAEVVEADLADRMVAEHLGGLRVEIPQQAVAHALVGEGEQLLLDRLDHVAGGPAAREGVVDVGSREVEAHREHAGEPAHAAGQVRARCHVFLAAVPFEPDQGRRLVDAAPAAPLGDGQGQCGQQTVVDPAVDGRGQVRQSGLGDRNRQQDPHLLHGGHHVHLGVQAPGAENGVGTRHHRAPQR